MPQKSFQLFLLGRFRLERTGVLLTLPTRKMESLLAYLALYPQPHSREKLAALLWGDSTDASARHSLSVALNTLRKTLGNEFVLADRATVQLHPDFPLWVDAKEFMISDPSLLSGQRFRFSNSKAPGSDDSASLGNHASKSEIHQSEIENQKSKIEIYQGDLLADFYEDWILAERERLRQAYLDALLALTQHLRLTGEYGQALEYAQRVLDSDPANERAHQHRMFCFAVLGEPQHAVEQYEKCVGALHDELGLDSPSPETIALYEWLKQTPRTRSLAARLTNLPLPPSSFIGRTHELAQLDALIASARLITLTGAGGSGKTRLAIRTGIHALDRFPDGVWWIDLASLNDPARVPDTVLHALGLPASTQETPKQTLAAALCADRRLLLFDNCEHLLDACAQLMQSLLQDCPHLVILTTSREPLNLTGEVVYLVPPLGFPRPDKLSVLDLLMQYEAIRLFVERAQARNRQFHLSDQNMQAVAQICARLDGIPLALELAAACTPSMSAAEIAARLDDRFQLLTRGERTALPRQQTLYALMDWSYNLLSEPERVLFRQLAVFAGGFTLDAVDSVYSIDTPPQIAPDAPSIPLSLYPSIPPSLPSSPSPSLPPSTPSALSFLARLVEKSLVVANITGETTRYAMLETIHEFAREKLLGDSDRYAGIRERHFRYLLELARRADRGVFQEQHDWLNLLDVEIDNFRAALAWSLDETGLYRESAGARAEMGLELFTALWSLWWLRGSMDEASEWLDKFLEASPDPTPVRARALTIGSDLARLRGDMAQGADYARRALALSEELGDPLHIGWGCMEMGVVVRDLGEPDRALAFFHRALGLFQSLLEPLWICRTLFLIAETHMQNENPEQADRFWQEGLEYARTQVDGVHVAWGLDGLAQLAQRRGDLQLADELAREALALKYRARDLYGLSLAFQVAAEVAAAQGTDERAALLWGAAEQLRSGQGIHLSSPQEKMYASLVPVTREHLGETQFTEFWKRGRDLPLEQAVAFALGRT